MSGLVWHNPLISAPPSPRPHSHPEQALQKAVVDYLALAVTDDTFWTAWPLGSLGNTGGGGKARGGQMKGLGVKVGMPDLLFFSRGCAFGIELKSAKGGLSKAQRAAHPMLARALVPVRVCRSVEEVEAALRGWGIALRGRVT